MGRLTAYTLVFFAVIVLLGSLNPFAVADVADQLRTDAGMWWYIGKKVGLASLLVLCAACIGVRPKAPRWASDADHDRRERTARRTSPASSESEPS